MATLQQVDGAWLAALSQNADPAAAIAAFFEGVVSDCGDALESQKVASALDAKLGELPSSQRAEFLVPKAGGLSAVDSKLVPDPQTESVYLVGNSLGLQPRRTRQVVNEELDKWAAMGVNGHFEGERPWMPIDEFVTAGSARVVGALESEVAIMNSLTLNLHLLLISFYQPQGSRTKILYEADAFGSDFFAFLSQVKLHGQDPATALLPLKAREGQVLLQTEDVVAAIREAGDTLATVCLGTVQYYTGQYFDVAAITAAAHEVGATAVWDCAHAAGNVDLKLHDWGVDGACWCTYKYMNSGPGAIAGFFVHEKHHGTDLKLLAGWWGQAQATRFNMAHEYKPEIGAAAYRLSNPPVLQTVSLMASLELFDRSSMAEIRGRSFLLTAYLQHIVRSSAAAAGAGSPKVSAITPDDPRARGAQLSLLFESEDVCKAVFAALERRALVMDYRKPNVIRVAPAPLYNTFSDLCKFGQSWREALAEASA